MWLIFALLGLWMGSASGALAGAVLGGLLGHLLKRVGDLQDRVATLERRMIAAPATSPTEAPVESEAPEKAQPLAEPMPEADTPPAPEFEPGIPPTSTAPDWVLETPATTVVAEPDHTPGPIPANAAWETSPPPRVTLSPDAWLGKLLAGNLLAKLGIVVLFFGVASGLKLAAEHGMFPPWTRLLGAALAGLAFIWSGASPATGGTFRPAWLFRISDMSPATRIGFGLALEGGGFGLLYLAVYFALSTYGYIAPATTFLLFAGLGVACIALALRQEGQALALLGLSGAFLAPALVGGEGQHRVLFAYIVLLDAFILWASLRRGWRPLILAGFGFSVLLGMGWADASYRPELRADVEALVVVLLALFSLTPVLAARRGDGPKAVETPQWGWQSATLLFGPPAAAAVAQAGLYDGDPDTLALSSLLAGLWYGLLWLGARRAGDDLLGRVMAGLAIAFLTLSPYLAFSQNTAGVFWALEGAGLIWYARRQERDLPMAAGVLLQLLSGLLLFDLWAQGPDGVPFRNSLFHASLLLAAAGAFSAFALRGTALVSRLFLVWSQAWWFGIWFWELGYVLYDTRRDAAMLLLAALTCLAAEQAGRRWSMPDARAVSLLLLPALAIVVLLTQLRLDHPLGANLWLALPVALAVFYATLRRHEQDGLDWYLPQRHVLGFWAVAWIPAWELFWQASRMPALGYSLPEALRGLGLALPLLLVLRLEGVWPLKPHRSLYLRQALALPVLLAWVWLFTWTVPQTGAWALPWLPVLNPLDLAGLLLLWTLYQHWQAAGRFGLEQGSGTGVGAGVASGYGALFGTLFPLALLAWLTMGLARGVHHYGGVPYVLDHLWHSALLQALVSLAWTAFALAAMVLASRRHARVIWFGGLALLFAVGLKLLLVDLANVSGLLRVLSLMGIGLLVLGAGYLAPVPPRKTA